MQEMGSMREPLEVMKGLIGDWDVDATIALTDGSSLEGSGTWTVREVSLGKGVHTVLRLQAGGRPMEENDLWGYDPGDHKLHMLSVTSDGNVHDHSGSVDQDNVLHLRWEGVVDNEPAHEHISIEVYSPDEVKVLSVEHIGEREQARMEMVLRLR